MQPFAERGMEQRQRIVTANQKGLRNAVLDLLHCLAELGFFLGILQFRQHLSGCANPFGDADDFIEDFYTLILDNASVIGEGCDTHPLKFGPATLQEVVTFSAYKGHDPRRRGWSERREFT